MVPAYPDSWVQTDESGNSYSKIAEFIPLCGPIRKALDIGCGAGNVSEGLIKQGIEVHGLDSQPRAVAKAKERGLKAQVHDLEVSLPFVDRSFDLVLALDVLDFVKDPAHLLTEIKRILSANGALILVVPVHFDLRQRLRILSGKGIISYKMKVYPTPVEPWNYLHIKFLNVNDVRRLLDTLGFEITTENFSPMWASNLSLFERAIFKILRIPWFVRTFPNLLSGSMAVVAKSRRFL